MNDVPFSGEIVAGLFGSALSFALEVIPGAKDLWAKIENKGLKALTILGIESAAVAGVMVLSCQGVSVGYDMACYPITDWQSGISAVLVGARLVASAFALSQVTFKVVSDDLGKRVAREKRLAYSSHPPEAAG